MSRDDNRRPGSGQGNRPNRPPHGSDDNQRSPGDSGNNRPQPPHDGGSNRPRPQHDSGNGRPRSQHASNDIARQPRGDYPPLNLKKQEEKNKRFVRAIMNDYAGQDVSELAAILLYLYENITLEPREKQLAEDILEISKNEMRHFHTLGNMIVSLGGNPEYHSEQPGSYFNAGNMTYPKTLKDILQINIQAETAAIHNYSQRVRMAPTPEIAETIQKIVEDERRHLAFFKKQYQRLFGR